MTDTKALTLAIDIGQQMLICGAESYRVEDTINRIGHAYGMKQCHVFSIASSITVSMQTGMDEWLTQTRRIQNYHTDMLKLDRLNDLSRYLCVATPDYPKAVIRFRKICELPEYSLRARCAFCAFIASAFTLFFGGNFLDAAASFIVGVILELTIFILTKSDINQVFLSIRYFLISSALLSPDLLLFFYALSDLESIGIRSRSAILCF